MTYQQLIRKSSVSFALRVSPRHDAVIQLSAGGHLMMRIW